jgi:peroxiredoxin
LDRRAFPLFVAIFAGLVLASVWGGVSLAQPRAVRTLSAADAMKELDLIRPSRQKLAQDFSLPTPDGKTFKLSDHRGKLVFVNFWATWCVPCREEMPAMEQLWKRHKDQGFMMVAVSVDNDTGLVAPFVRKLGLTFPIALDSKMQAANPWGVRALPSSFIIDRKGYMTALALGPRAWDNDAAHALIDALVK